VVEPVEAIDEIEPQQGYELHQLHATEQICVAHDAFDDEEDGSVSVSWDWRIEGERDFAVALGISIPATENQVYEIRAVVVGRFGVLGENPPLSFSEFCRFGATAILFPYVRETISSLTGRTSNSAPLLLPPTNLKQLLGDFGMDGGSGMGQLEEFPLFMRLLEQE